MAPFLPALRAAFVVCATLGAVTSTQAQPASANGEWSASFADREGRPRQATLKVDGAGGSWRVYAPPGRGANKNNACVAIEIPVAVRAGAEDELLVDVDGEKPVAGCGGFTLNLKRVDANTYDGSFSDSRAVHLVRK
jgi:hypothetical protein